MNYNLTIGKGLGSIQFDFRKKEILNVLGKPEKIIRDDDFVSLKYPNFGLFFDFEKEKNKLIDLNIHTTKISYKNKNWFNCNKTDLFEIIKDIYKTENVKFDYSYSKIKVINEEQFDFDEIGVTLFFKKNKLTNVALSKPLI